MTLPRKLLITSGEPAGIGPDICVRLAHHVQNNDVVVVADPEVLRQRADVLGERLRIYDYRDAPHQLAPGELSVASLAIKAPVQAGQLNVANSAYVLEMLRFAADRCLAGEFQGVVTGPVHKGVINESGLAFSGHTEFFAEQCNTDLVVMMLVAPRLRVALVTTHVPLAAVADMITPVRLRRICEILNHDLRLRFNIPEPLILVCGLNPHAGEDGYLGQEDERVTKPVLADLKRQGVNLLGPYPADSLFTPSNLERADAFLAMYHDQGLPVLKALGFGESVNVTLGLPIIRTSVDHGTALELAGTGQAQASSLLAAIDLAKEMAAHSERL